MTRPDFGYHTIEHDGVKLSCRYIVPGVTMHDLAMIFERAKGEAAPGDHLADNRGIYAVVEAILSAIYADEK